VSRPGFFDENQNRSYPFQVGSVGVNVPASGPVTMLQLPDAFVVDCGFTVSFSETFDPAAHDVFLYAVRRTGQSTAQFEFRCSDPSLSPYPLIFERSGDDKFVTYYHDGVLPYSDANSDSGDDLFPSYNACGWPFWYGYAVFGPFSVVADRLAVGEEIVRTTNTQSIVLPSLVVNSSGSRITSINVANKDRTRSRVSTGCNEYVWSFPTGQTYVRSQCLGGNVGIVAGYNMSLNQVGRGSNLAMAPTVNAGLGQPCGEIKLFDSETGPTGHSNGTLSGDLLCNEVFRTVNGLGGPAATLIPGQGVSIVGNPNTNTVVIDVNLNSLAICDASDTIDISESV
jgi:hypothetical protein